MRVTLTRRVGLNDEGSTIEVSDIQGQWLIDRGYAKTESKSTTSSKATDQGEEKGNVTKRGK